MTAAHGQKEERPRRDRPTRTEREDFTMKRKSTPTRRYGETQALSPEQLYGRGLILAVALAAVFGPGLDSVGHLFGWW